MRRIVPVLTAAAIVAATMAAGAAPAQAQISCPPGSTPITDPVTGRPACLIEDIIDTEQEVINERTDVCVAAPFDRETGRDTRITGITEETIDDDPFTILRTITTLTTVSIDRFSRVCNDPPPPPPPPSQAPPPGGDGGARDLAPALEVSQEIEQEAQSGEVDLSFEVSNEGDFAQQCIPALQFGQTGNLQNAQGFVQFGSEADDFEAEGIEFAFEPELDVECDRTVQQSAAAG